jgi:hemerythrin-like domain-containing protein
MNTTEHLLQRLDPPPYARSFAAMHQAMRRDGRRLVTSLDTASDHRAPAVDVGALGRWFELLTAVIEHHHACEDDIVWPALAALIARGDAGTVGEAFLDARQRLLDDHHDLDAAMHAVQQSLAALSSEPAARRLATARDRSALRHALECAQHFATCLDTHLACEEGALYPLLHHGVSASQFAEIEAAVEHVTPLRSVTFTFPWIVEGAGREVVDIINDKVPTAFRLVNRWVLEPRYRRLIAAATGATAR